MRYMLQQRHVKLLSSCYSVNKSQKVELTWASFFSKRLQQELCVESGILNIPSKTVIGMMQTGKFFTLSPPFTEDSRDSRYMMIDTGDFDFDV